MHNQMLKSGISVLLISMFFTTIWLIQSLVLLVWVGLVFFLKEFCIYIIHFFLYLTFLYIIKLHNFSPPILLNFSKFRQSITPEHYHFKSSSKRNASWPHLPRAWWWAVCTHHTASLLQELAGGRAHLMNGLWANQGFISVINTRNREAVGLDESNQIIQKRLRAIRA